MARPASGNVTQQLLADGTTAFHLRFRVEGRRESETLHERCGCRCGCGGGSSERTAAIELENVLASVRAGAWRKRREPAPAVQSTGAPAFHVCASAWLASKVPGVLGDRPIDTNTENDYRWRLDRHLLPFFGEYRLDEIDARLCVAVKAHKLREVAELRAAIAVGARFFVTETTGGSDHSGRRRFGSSSTASARSWTKPSRTSTSIAIPPAADGCASTCRSPLERSRRWTSSSPWPTRGPSRTPGRQTADPQVHAHATAALGSRRVLGARDAPDRYRRRARAFQGDCQLPPAPPRRGGPGDLRRPPRDRRHARRR